MSDIERRKVLILSTDEDFSDFKLDLGDISPAVACTMLKAAYESIKDMLPLPVITSYETVIMDPYDWAWDEDEDL